MTLFALIVNNNWQYITLMCVNVVNGNTIYRLYFEVFYYFGVILGVNMFVPSQLPTGLKQIASLGDRSLVRHNRRRDIETMKKVCPERLISPHASVGCVGLPKGGAQLAILCVVRIVS